MLDRGQRRSPGEAGQRPQPALVIGKQQVVAPADRGAQRAPPFGAPDWSGPAEPRTGCPAVGRSPAPTVISLWRRRARWPAAGRRANGTVSQCCRGVLVHGQPRPDLVGPAGEQQHRIRDRSRAPTDTPSRPPVRAAVGWSPARADRWSASSSRPIRSAAASTTCSQLSNTSRVSAAATRSMSACSPGRFSSLGDRLRQRCLLDRWCRAGRARFRPVPAPCRATSMANRVLPTPGVPTSVTSRWSRTCRSEVIDVVFPADQWRGQPRQVAGRRCGGSWRSRSGTTAQAGILVQDSFLELLQFRAGLQTEFVDQRFPHPGVGRQARRPAGRPGRAR